METEKQIQREGGRTRRQTDRDSRQRDRHRQKGKEGGKKDKPVLTWTSDIATGLPLEKKKSFPIH